MDKINELFECQIGDAINAFPSVFSKDDVVLLLSNLRTNVLHAVADALSEANAVSISEMDFQEFSSDVSRKLERALNDGTIYAIDLDSAEFTIGYHNTIEIESINVDADNIVEELANILLDEFQIKFGKFITSEAE
jgi:hypothetical protein